MLHLLTETQKQRVIKEYRMRLVIVVSWLIVFISFSGMALLLPSYLSAISKVNLVKSDNQYKEDSIKALDAQNFNEKIKKVDFNMQALKKAVGVISPDDVYAKITASLPPNVYLSRYTYNLINNDSGSISLDGVAINRDSLVELQNRLKANTEFTGVDIPITNFTKKKDLNFSLKFNLVNAKK